MAGFDYEAALKEQPESEVAQYLADQHGVNRAEYLKDGHSDADFIKEYGPKNLPEQEEDTASYNKTGAATLGALAGASPTIARTGKGLVQGAARGFLGIPAQTTIPPISTPPAGGLPTASVQVMSPDTGEVVHGGQNWVKKLTGVDLPGAQMEKAALDKAKEMSSVVGRGGELAGGEITSSGIMLPPARTTAEQAAIERAALREQQLSEMGQAAARKYLAEKAAQAAYDAANPSVGTKLLQVGKGVLENPVVNKALRFAGPIVSGASAAEQYEDMRERIHHKDYGPAFVSGLGALGSGVAAVPYFPPQVRAIGAGVGLAAPLINYGADKVFGRSYAAGGLAYLADGSQPPKPDADDGADTGPYIGYRPVQRQAQNQYGPGNGFLDAALGVPAQHTNVLDPRDASYMSGYEKGEPVGIAFSAFQLGAPIAKGAMLAGTIARPNISEMLSALRNRGGTAAATRLERAADLVPNLENQYTTDALKEALSGGSRSGLMVLNPNDFQKFAVPLTESQKTQTKGYRIGKPSAESGYANLPWGSYDEYIRQLQGHVQPGAGGFTSVPYFQLANEDERIIPEIYGHEGRHRTEALTGLGEDKTLVKVNPIGKLKGQLGGETNEEFLNKVKEKFGNPTLVRPESSPNYGTRDSIYLPEMFKKGGKV